MIDSNRTSIKFSVVVPTYKRPEVLRVALESILVNTRFPDEVIVIDDDVVPDAFIAEMEKEFTQKSIPFFYRRKDHTKIRRGLSESKNWSTELAKYDIVCFIDDDVELNPEHFSSLLRIWEKNWSDGKLFGIGGRALNHRTTLPMERLFRVFFGLSSKHSWDVNEVGFQVWDESVKENQKAYYLHGCSSSYRRSLLKKMPFATFSGGRTALEDVDHCLGAKNKGYHFIYAPEVKLMHYHHPAGRDLAWVAGVKESKNRKEIYKRHCSNDLKHKLWFCWANIGWILKKILAFKFKEAGGMVVGLFS